MVNFFIEGTRFKLPRGFKSACRSVIHTIITDHSKRVGDINIILVSDEIILKVNRQYLNHDYFTDIITFEYNREDIVSGDLFISTDRISENAKLFRCDTYEELKRVIFHGCLHLVGYNDSSLQQKEEMVEKENYYLKVCE